MAKQFPKIEATHRSFIERQHIFFVGSAAQGTRVNVSPKGLDAFRLIDDHAAVYLDHTGSGNETAAHLAADGRLTIMFCAFDGPPLILRLYGRGRILPRGGAEYRDLLETLFGDVEPVGARQMVRIDFDLVQTSCGFGVPLYDYEGERPSLPRWAASKGEEGIVAYRREKNSVSMDGLPTFLVEADEAAAG
ncbi:pyridoxamine 5'-phosphate oxidase family protein [Prosthecomicrobium pneumaticum]|uniref:Pyridoxamine 5'-phosphate oxidase N-terminal domain-containing protein n=1 Tax=Prosthecomicrobium pneumaticum TaxID=81895 RepID=A0A7W9FKM9_9HYPH|nr:pyridoxamine 5'-phosphate oxidase family protein [Prosthecomicrobium pneumaticum]MBB5751108.1 hypothetical protein [Prosthecomicrobium pneumaticum]